MYLSTGSQKEVRMHVSRVELLVCLGSIKVSRYVNPSAYMLHRIRGKEGAQAQVQAKDSALATLANAL